MKSEDDDGPLSKELEKEVQAKKGRPRWRKRTKTDLWNAQEQTLSDGVPLPGKKAYHCQVVREETAYSRPCHHSEGKFELIKAVLCQIR